MSTIPSMRERVHTMMTTGGAASTALLLAASLSIGGLASPQPALAYDEATFTIEAKDNAQQTYRVFHLFGADIAPNPSEGAADTFPGLATHISWAGDDMRETVLAFLDAHGYPDWLKQTYRIEAGSDAYARQHGLPQNAAAYIAGQIGASENDTGAATTPATKAAQSFALELARALAASGSSVESTQTDDHGNATYTGEQGYYLFVTDDASIRPDESGSSPIWVPLGSARSSVVAKSACPTLSKQVREDSTGSFGKVADASKDEDLDYLLTATLPDNIGAYDSYRLRFDDALPTGMELSGNSTSSVQVSVNTGDASHDITQNAHVAVAYKDSMLSVEIDDLKSTEVDIGKDSTVTVAYRAHLTDESVIGAAGNLNSAVLTYSNNPATNAVGTTLEDAHRTRTCTWRIQLQKVDKQTGTALPGAVFTIQAADAAVTPGESSAAAYVQADGSLGSDAHEFTTGDDGSFTIPRTDSGRYTIRETHAPEGYEIQDSDITLEIQPQLDQASGTVSSWRATLAGGEAASDGSTEVATHLVDADDEAAMSTALDTGNISIMTSDDKKVALPITGMDGTTAAIVYGGGAILLGLVGIGATRRKRDGDGSTPDFDAGR